MVSRANTLGVVSITRDLDARCPVLMWPLPPKRFRFSLRRVFSGKRIVLIGRGGEFPLPSGLLRHNSVGIGPTKPREALFLSGLPFIGGKLGGR